MAATHRPPPTRPSSSSPRTSGRRDAAPSPTASWRPCRSAVPPSTGTHGSESGSPQASPSRYTLPRHHLSAEAPLNLRATHANVLYQEHRPMSGRDLQIALAHLCAAPGRHIGPLKEPYPSPSILDLGARLEGGPPRRLRSRDVISNRICGSRDPFLPFKGPLECLLPWPQASPWSETLLSLSVSRYRHVSSPTLSSSSLAAMLTRTPPRHCVVEDGHWPPATCLLRPL